MVYRVIIHKEVLVNVDEDFPVGDSGQMTEEQIDYIWDAVENDYIQEDEYIEEVE